MNQYLCVRDDADGENRDMFVTAEGHDQAIDLAEAHWRAELELDEAGTTNEEFYEDKPWRAFLVPAPKLVPGVHEWFGDVPDMADTTAATPAP